MAPRKKSTAEVKQEPEVTEQEPTNLRRSSRATRGSVKPLLDLVKADPEPDDADDYVEKEEEEEFVPATKTGRRTSTAKREPAKKEPVKRASNKKPVAKKEPIEADATVKEETETIKTTKSEHLDEAEEDGDNECSYELNEKEMKEINHAFDMNRLGDDNEILNTDGLKTAIRSLGFEPRVDEIKKLMKMFSKGNKVNRDGFHRMMAYKFSISPAMNGANRGGNDEISRVFNLLDLDKTGMITFENLKSIAKELNEDLNDDDLREMISEADKDHDFMINKHEFEDIMKKTSLY